MIELSAYDFSIDPPQTAIREWWQVLINIEATFCITVGKVQMSPTIALWNWSTRFGVGRPVPPIYQISNMSP